MHNSITGIMFSVLEERVFRVIASINNKLTPLRIAWQQKTSLSKVLPALSTKHKLNNEGKETDKAIEEQSPFTNCKMPEQPKGYLKAPRYEFF